MFPSAKKIAIRHLLSDLSPPLGRSDSPCDLIQRIDDEIANPRQKEQLLSLVEKGQDLSNGQARTIYNIVPTQGVGKLKFKEIKITPHAQYRMDLRGIDVKELKSALYAFQKDVQRDISQRGYSRYEDYLERGNIAYTSPSKLKVVFEPLFKGVRRVFKDIVGCIIISAYFINKKPPLVTREQCGIRQASVPKRYENIDFKPPASVASEAKKGLEYRQKSGKGGLSSQEAGKAGIGSGVQRAVNLKNRNNLTPETIKMMRGFFSRHEKNKSISAENRDTPWEDAGHVAWLLWGGDAGKKWADKIIKQMEDADEKEKKDKTADLDDIRHRAYRRREKMEVPYGKVPNQLAPYRNFRRFRKKELIEEVDMEENQKKTSSQRVALRWLCAKKSWSKTEIAKKTRELMEGNGKDAFLSAASKASGVKKSILKEVHERGSAAWQKSHTPGVTQAAWARARVYSFLSGGTTQKTTDKDLWDKHKGKK